MSTTVMTIAVAKNMTRSQQNETMRARVDHVHRTLATLGEPTTVSELASLLETEEHLVRRSIEKLLDAGFIEAVGKRVVPGRGARPGTTYGLTDRGRDEIPDPTPHMEIGRRSSLSAASLHPGDMTDFRNHGSHAVAVGPTRSRYAAPTRPSAPAMRQWPLLEEILARDTVVNRLRDAANALPTGDELRASLEQRIASLSARTPLEEEYVRYAHEHLP